MSRCYAFLVPGQGMERAGMGVDIARHFAPAADLLDCARHAARLSSDLQWSRPGRALHRTEVVQPALTAVALGAAAALAVRHIYPSVVLGHSVGEVAAWGLAGGVAPQPCIELAAQRGVAMARAARAAPGGMRALSQLPDSLPEGVVVAAYNPNQVVVSGPIRGLRDLPHGRDVPTEGPWHSPAMLPAANEWARDLARLPHVALSTPIIRNRTGALFDESDFRDDLLHQLTHPVHWTASLRTMAAVGVTDAVILGPSKLLRHHMRQVLPELRVHPVERMAHIDALADAHT